MLSRRDRLFMKPERRAWIAGKLKPGQGDSRIDVSAESEGLKTSPHQFRMEQRSQAGLIRCANKLRKLWRPSTSVSAAGRIISRNVGKNSGEEMMLIGKAGDPQASLSRMYRHTLPIDMCADIRAADGFEGRIEQTMS